MERAFFELHLDDSSSRQRVGAVCLRSRFGHGVRQWASSVVAWCGEHGVSASSFYVWRQKLAESDARPKSRWPPLLPVEILPLVAGESRAPLVIELPSPARVRVGLGCELKFLRQVLAMLQRLEAVTIVKPAVEGDDLPD